jgi:hypothetical protein
MSAKLMARALTKQVSYPGLACAAILAALYPSANDALAALNEVDKRRRSELKVRLPREMAILAFISGGSLQMACNSVGAQLSKVERHLRDICRKRQIVEI